MVLPLCRCRVLYIGSAVPTITKDGLQGIQQPLKERYPIEDTPETRGIDSWLSVWSNGILLEYIEGDKKSETNFWPINTLHYCAAVRFVNITGYAIEGGGERFLPLDSPFANIPDSPHPPIFAAMLRRTTGVKVLECHGFICTNSKAANALVRCCFHAYADSIYLKMEDKIPGLKAIKEGSSGERSPGSPESDIDNRSLEAGEDQVDNRPSHRTWERRQQDGEYDSVSISSSMVRGQKKAASDAGRGAVVPYVDGPPPRRAGSDVDLSFRERGPHLAGGPPHRHPGPFPPPFPPGHMHGFPPFPPMFGPPPPGMRHMPPPFPPPPPHMMRHHPAFFHPPPPHHMPIPSHMRGRFPPPPPPFFSHFGPPPRGNAPSMFFPPPPPFGMPPPFARPTTPEGPIITGPESVYGTMRRNAYEEPAYVATGHGLVPEASYQPSNYPDDHYQSYYDTFKKRTLKKSGPGESSSLTSSNRNESVWDQYEYSIYRRPHMNERAFGGTLRSTKDTSNATLNRPDHAEVASQTVEADIIRPDTPPIDYEAFENMKVSAATKNGGPSTSTPNNRMPVY